MKQVVFFARQLLAALILIFVLVDKSFAVPVNLVWNPPQTFTDGSEYILPAQSGYKLYTKIGNGAYDSGVRLVEDYERSPTIKACAGSAPNSSICPGKSLDLDPNNKFYQFKLTAVSKNGKESVASPELTIFALSVSGSGIGTGAVTGSGLNCRKTTGACSTFAVAGGNFAISAVADNDSIFTGWSGSGCTGTNPNCFLPMNAFYAPVANFSSKATVSLSKYGTGKGSLSAQIVGSTEPFLTFNEVCSATFSDLKCSTKIANTGAVKVTAVPDSTSVFAGWSEPACGNKTECTIGVSASLALQATFMKKTAKVSVRKTSQIGSGGSVVALYSSGSPSPQVLNCGNTCDGTVPLGTVLSFNATPDVGSSFSGWSGACSGQGVCKVTVTSDTVINASFVKSAPKFSLVVGSVSSLVGTVTVDQIVNGKKDRLQVCTQENCTINLEKGSIVELSAAAAAGSVLTGWSSTCIGVGACRLEVSSAATIKAVFQKEYTAQIEAETATITAPMKVVDEKLASGNKYVSVVEANKGVASIGFNISQPGIYWIWIRAQSASTGQDTINVGMDSSAAEVADLADNQAAAGWRWLRINSRNGGTVPLKTDPRIFNLSAGLHTLHLRGIDSNVKIDQIVVTNNPGLILGDGGNLETIRLNITGRGKVKYDGQLCQTACEDVIEVGAVVLLESIPDAAAKIKNWDGLCAGNSSSCAFTLIGPKAIRLEFEELVPSGPSILTIVQN